MRTMMILAVLLLAGCGTDEQQANGLAMMGMGVGLMNQRPVYHHATCTGFGNMVNCYGRSW